MDILSKLPFIDQADDEATEKTEAELKAERIAFHRTSVRNGPIKFRHITEGQERRRLARWIKSQTKKTHRQQVKNYFETQRIAANVRAHLQAAGVLPFFDGRDIDLHKQVVSAAWLVKRFGEEGEDGTVSFAYDDVLAALQAALKFWGQAVGSTPAFPADYVVPVYEEGTGPA